jgi:molybdenum cofactor cytidylyltransferase
MIVSVILAAGEGTRMGNKAKALISVPGEDVSFLERIVTTSRAAGVATCLVVTGSPHHDDVAAEAARLGAVVVENPMPWRGMASSVAAGFACAMDRYASYRSALLWPVDVPLVEVETVRAVLTTEPDAAVVIPTYDGRGGHPPRVDHSVWPALARCQDQPMGAKSVFHSQKPPPLRMAVSDRGIVRDFDTVDDLK